MRLITGQTQKEFADRFDIPLGTLRRWEYGESTPAPYVVRLIAKQLSINKEYYKKIGEGDNAYYYDTTSNIIMDCKGVKIQINESMEGVNEHNLVIYAKDLFDAYYDSIDRFNRDCKLDKAENIIWGK